jgi:hypothetical protein
MSTIVPFIDMQLGSIQRDVQGMQLTVKHLRRFEFPREFPTESLEIARRDLEHIAERLRHNPERVQTLLQAVVAGRGTEVRRLTEELGLRQSDFQEQGWGIFWVVVMWRVLCERRLLAYSPKVGSATNGSP